MGSRSLTSSQRRRALVAIVAAAVIVACVAALEWAERGLVVTETTVGDTPVTVRHLPGVEGRPAVVIAHGFAGSRQLMEPFAVTLAQAGYVTAAFDYMGHGRNPSPLVGDVTKLDEATAALVAETRRVGDFASALPQAGGGLALLGHSMASDVVVRAAGAEPAAVDAVVAVSMFTRAVMSRSPRNLLIVVGGWERFLAEEALNAVRLAVDTPVVEGETYEIAPDNRRRAVLADNVEHVGVLYSSESLIETRDWLDTTFGRESSNVPPDARGPLVLGLLAAVVALGWPLAALLPRLAAPEPRSLGGNRLAAAVLAPAILTPLALWPIPTDFLPVLVADYMALHFLLYGILTGGALRRSGAQVRLGGGPKLALIAVVLILWSVLALALPLDAYVANFMPHSGRIGLIAVLGLGTVVWAVADEALMTAAGRPWWIGPLTKVMLLSSLGLAVWLDLDNLFFLIIILPVMILFFLVYGLFSRWAYRRTLHPLPGALGVGVAFAWALGVTFPLIAA